MWKEVVVACLRHFLLLRRNWEKLQTGSQSNWSVGHDLNAQSPKCELQVLPAGLRGVALTNVSIIIVNHVVLWQCEWNLLLQLNLASQSVLEGLNACLDHRGEVFIPELGKTFYIQSDSTRLFGAQNPLRQGGARRGLPQSFLNRFTQVGSCHCTVFIVNYTENCEEDYCHLGCAATLCSEWLMAFLQNSANHIHSYALSPSRTQNAQLHHAENLKTCIDDKFLSSDFMHGQNVPGYKA